MISTINTAQVETLKLIKSRYLAAAAGIALAVTAVVGGLSLRDGPSPAAAPAPASIAQPATGFPLVQEFSHPQIVEQGSATSSEFAPNGDALVQEQSHPQLPATQPTASDIELGGFPLVQEQSHPLVPGTDYGDDAAGEDNGAYPLVQEMSHPR